MIADKNMNYRYIDYLLDRF